MWFKNKYRKSQWFLGLLDAEQHSHEGYDDQYLIDVANKKFNRNLMDTEAHIGVHDYFWYKQNVLDTLYERVD